MALEDNDIQEQLQQAPPHAPTADDAEANKATADSAAAQSLVKAASGSTDLEKAEANDKMPRPSGVWQYREKPEAPDIGQNAPPVAPGSFAEHLSNALVKAKSSLAPGAMAAPGAWSKLMVGATMDALSSPWQAALSNADASKPTSAPVTAPRPAFGAPVLAQLGDAAAASGPGGLVGGFARAAAAGTQRTREELNDRRLLATSNAQMLHEQALTHKLGEDAINASIESSKAQMENITTAVPGAPPDAAGTVLAKDKTSDELNTMIQSGELKPTEQTVFATGRVLTGKDQNGVPQYRTTYTVIKPAKEVDLTPENAKYLNDNLGTDYSTDKDKPQRLPGVQVNDLFQKANNARATKKAFEVKEAQEDETIRKAQTSKDAEAIFKNPIVMNAINGHMTSPDDPYAIVKAYDAIMNNPKLKNDPSMPRNFSEAYIQAAGGTAVWDKKVEEYSKAQQKNTDTVDDMLTRAEKDPKEIEGHTPAFIAAMKSLIADPDAPADKKARAAKILATTQDIKALELELEGAKEKTKEDVKAGAGRGPESDKVGEEFLATLPQSRRRLVEGMGNGQIPASPSALARTDKGQALLSDIFQAYPDFDSSKGETWYKTRNEYAGTGQTAKGTISINVAMGHMKRLFDNSTAEGLYNPLSQAYRDRQADFALVTNEVGKAVKAGVMTEGEAKEIRDAMGGWIPSSARERAAEVTRLLKNRLDETQTKFDDAAPSKIIKVPRLLSKDAANAYDYIQSGGKPAQSKLPANAPPGAIQRPADLPTATHTQAFTKNGVTKIFWTDEAGKPLREATEIPKE